MIDTNTIKPYDTKQYHHSLVSWLGNLAGQIESIKQSEERIKKREALFAEDMPEGDKHE